MKQIIDLFKHFFACILLLCSYFAPLSAAESVDSVLMAQMNNLEVSLLTCEPHDEVYSLYGHTAIRIEDKVNGNDWAVNWGVFDSTAKFFVLRFIFGLTDYTVAIINFKDFIAEYNYYGCAVYQQRLNLTAEQKLKFMQLLNENLQPENLIYRYNFYYNNCTTKARDIIFHAAQSGSYFVQWPDHDDVESSMTFRDLIHNKTEKHPWARWGNDILLGLGSDQPTRNHEREFLPEILMRDFDEAKIVKKPTFSETNLVDSTFVVLAPGVPYQSNDFNMPFTPTQCAVAFFCVILSLLAYQYKTKKRLPWVNFAVVGIYGIFGIFITLMLFSQHPTVRINLQILICNPLMFYLAFPKTKLKYRWHIVFALCLAFFAGNAIQSYAEGMNVMALALSFVAISNILMKN